MLHKRFKSRAAKPCLIETLEPRALFSADLSVVDTGFSNAANVPAPIPGDDFYLQPTIHSTGSDAPTNFRVAIYLSPTPSLTPQSILISDQMTFTFSAFEGSLPTTLTPGTWYPIVIADPDNQIPESDESNNTLIGNPIQIASPDIDLVAPSSSFANGTIRPAGSDANITPNPIPAPYTIFPLDPISFNSSSSTSPSLLYHSITYSYALSSDNIAGNADDIPLGTIGTAGSRWAPGPQPIYVTPFIFPPLIPPPFIHFDIPANTPLGTYHLITTIDPNNTIAETDESNNSTLGATVTIVPSDSVDISAGGLSIFPSTLTQLQPTPGSQFSVLSSPQQLFGQPVSTKVNYILSSDQTLGNADDILLGSQNLDPISSFTNNGWPTITLLSPITLTLPSSLTPGQYHLFSVVDPDNQIPEYDETNNITSIPFTVAPADNSELPTPPSPTPPANPTPPITYSPIHLGSSANARITLHNSTNHAITSKYKVTFYLSDDSHLSSNDKPFETKTITTTLKPQQQKTFTLAYMLPLVISAGHRYIIAAAAHVPHITAALRAMPVTILAPVLTPSIQSVTPDPLIPGLTAVTIRLSNTGDASAAHQLISLRLYSNNQLLRSIRRTFTLKPHKSSVVVLAIPTTVAVNLRAALNQIPQ
ncbi:MAG TPA: CARDB domain-containing protein [Tepidisphaeraceae bacterium]|jgi:hypothetical protein|nr:CARDB domain-containing protein [Tepidisphaeraceae bacterium]